MPNSSEEMRLRDIAIGLQAELNESLFQREKFERVNAELRNEIQNLNDRIRMEQQVTEKLLRVIVARDSEITAIRQSHTWKIGSLVLAPVGWIRRRKR
jgi:hypothetical protein